MCTKTNKIVQPSLILTDSRVSIFKSSVICKEEVIAVTVFTEE